MAIDISKIRNVAFIGHSGEGKTTLSEAFLFNAKVIDRQGRVDDGNTVMDFTPEEIAKKSSISLAVASATFSDGYKFNIIDVPGFFDFEGEMYQALSACDAAVIVTSASGNLSVGTENAIDCCIELQKPCMIFISGLDKENSTFHRTCEAIRAKYPKLVASFFIPSVVDDKIIGFVSVSSGKYYSLSGENLGEMPEHIKPKYEREFNELSEVAAENDEVLLDTYIERALTMEELERGINIGMKTCGCIPVVGGSGLQNQCVMYLRDKMIALFPSPKDAKKPIALSGDDYVEIDCDPSGPVVLHVFKTIVDPFFGKLSVFKVLSGTLKAGMTLHNMGNDQDEKISAIYSVRGKKQDPVSELCAGDIGAVNKLDDIRTGDTLCGDGIRVKLDPIKKPSFVYSMAVYAEKRGEEDKIFQGLRKLREEDTCFSVTKNEETGEMILSGVGETQLDLLCKKLKSKYGCSAVLKEPKIAYRETIKRRAEAEGKHKKQGGGAGQYGVCSVRFEPGAEDGVYEFVDAVVGGAVPKQFIPAVDKGLREAIMHGVLAGYPMVNLKCTLFDGKSHPVDSKEVAFVSAAKLAYADGIPKATPVILEPIMAIEIIVPQEYLGDVMGDMNKRRGRILGTSVNGNKQIIEAEVPHSEILRYATDLRSMTQGRGKYSTRFERYEEVPQMYVAKIVEDSKKD